MDTSNSTPSVNGEHTKPAKKRKPRKKVQSAVEALIDRDRVQKAEEGRGRLASDLEDRKAEFLVKPWIPRGMLTMVVGEPDVGKSTFAAFLMAQAARSVLLPGMEEDIDMVLPPRLRVHGANLRTVRVLDDRHYTLPRDKNRILSIMTGWEAELLIVDPVDSYMDEEMSENHGPDVRPFLESFAAIARETGAAVVTIRHPGKDRNNLYPGSRQWRAVPRSIVKLSWDGGEPPRLLLTHARDFLGQRARVRQYELQGADGEAKRFVVQGEVDGTLNDLAMVANDPTGRRKVLEAAQLIRHLFTQDEKPAVQELVAQCRLLGIGEHARDEAKRLLGIITAPLESGGKWVMFRQAKDWPSWLETADSPA